MKLVILWTVIALLSAIIVKTNIKLDRKSLGYALLAQSTAILVFMAGIALYTSSQGISQTSLMSLYIGVAVFLTVFASAMYALVDFTFDFSTRINQAVNLS